MSDENPDNSTDSSVFEEHVLEKFLIGWGFGTSDFRIILDCVNLIQN